MQPSDFDIISYELEDIRQNITYLREYDKELSDLYTKIEVLATKLADKIEKRNEYTFIHGELGPNHVIVDKDNNAYLIDIEGAKYYDVEEELSFLDIRFNKMLRKAENTVDEQRIYFYHIGHCLGYLRGTMELKQKGYYDIDDVNGTIKFFHEQVIEIIRQENDA